MAAEREQPKGKNIVICLDGTGNQFKEDLSNVVKLFRVLERDPERQVAYYDPGVGTLADPGLKTSLGKQISKVLGAGFGLGLTRNIEQAYSYLMERYEDGDRIYLFGFSRGAYTARALAAVIKDCGLLERGSQNMFPYAMELFRQRPPELDPAARLTAESRALLAREKQKYYRLRSMFKSTYARGFEKPRARKGENPRHYKVPIAFLGLWDTVKSYGWITNPVVFRSEEGKNSRVATVRHALAIDEKRAFFRQMHWKPSPGQDFKEVWFPGVHSDVGGGYPESESQLAKISLQWMIEQACDKGLRINADFYRQIVLGRVGAEPAKGYVGPDAVADAHESLQGAGWEAAQAFAALRSPETKGPRPIRSSSRAPVTVHQSVLDRMRLRKDYRPRNLLASPHGPADLPPGCEVEPTTSEICAEAPVEG